MENDPVSRSPDMRKVREENTLLRTLLENTPDVIARIDRDGRRMYINTAVERATGIPVSEYIGRRIDEPPFFGGRADVAHRTAEKLSRVFSVGVGETIEYAYGPPEMGKYFHTHIVPERNETGKVMSVLTISHDITDRKRAEEALRESQEHVRLLIEHAPVALAMFDREMRYLSVSRRWLVDYKLGTRSLIGLSHYEVFPEVPEYWKLIHRRVLGGEVLNAENDRFERADGSVQWLRWEVRPWRDTTGVIAGVVIFSEDITERKQAEEMLKRTKEQAEAASRAKGEFLAHMSHEIRTPIGGIIGMMDVLSSRIQEPDQQGYLALVKESAESLLGIIGEILDFSRIEAGQCSVDPAECDLRMLLESVFSPFRLLIEKKGLDLSLQIEEDVPSYIRVDKEKIAQILRNLVSNAVKYTEHGRVRVTVDGEEIPDAGRARIRFRVQDTGIGIPEEQCEAIFDSFVRLRSSVNERNAEGTGLGLTITRRLADLLGGTLELESAPGMGSTFTFSLEVERIESIRPKKSVVSTSGIGMLRPLRILLVEDNRINQMFVSTVLTEAGHTVVIAQNGQEALETIERVEDAGFDLVLMDVQMPVMDGLEATVAIRRLSGPVSEVPIIALTAFAMKGDEQRFLATGMNGYVTKPIDWADLARVIRELGGKIG